MAVAEKAVGMNVDIEAILETFVSKVEASEIVELDGIIYKGEQYKNVVDKNDAIKILNHTLKTAYVLDVEALLEHPAKGIVDALETGVTERLYGVTRIVGYYSRTSNWNKSKLGELRDRHKGNYSVA